MQMWRLSRTLMVDTIPSQFDPARNEIHFPGNDGPTQRPAMHFGSFCALHLGNEFIDSVGHCLIVSDQLAQVNGHGYMLEPPSRNSAWRAGFNTPLDVDDNGHNCGGFAVRFLTLFTLNLT